ncbi:MAG: OBG GTPase family GTP-binding protein [Thermoplasmatota archaeon]
MGIDEEIQEIEQEIRETPYNKATQHHIGRLKAKLARLRDKKAERAAKSTGGSGFAVKKSGDATVGVVGFPSVGKSTLLNRLTNAKSETADYDFTTTKIVPGVMDYEGCKIQLLDLPGIIHGAAEGKGEGKKIISMARVVDLILILVDAGQPAQLDHIHRELYRSGIRLDEKPPAVSVKKKGSGGISIELSRQAALDEQTARGIAQEYLVNADISIRGRVNVEQFIDALADNRVYIPSVVACNKIDIHDGDCGEGIPISAKTGEGLEQLRECIFEKLDIARVYLKPQHGKPDMERPLVVKKGAEIADVCREVHRAFEENFRYAAVWGPSAAFPGQRVGLDHVVRDGDIVTIVIR